MRIPRGLRGGRFEFLGSLKLLSGGLWIVFLCNQCCKWLLVGHRLGSCLGHVIVAHRIVRVGGQIGLESCDPFQNV